MARIILVLIFFLPPFMADAQDSLGAIQENTFRYLHDSSDNHLGLSCGFAGSTTDNFYYIRDLITYKRFDLVEKLLFSSIPATRYLAAQTLISSEKRTLWTTDSLTRLKIVQLKSDTEKIYDCKGCIIGRGNRLKNLLKKHSTARLARVTKKWIRDSLEEML
jgi:hypothetical protein